MEVPINPELQAKVGKLAAQQGRAVEAVIIEAVENMVNHDEWLLSEVEKGLDAADRDELVDHSEVRALIDKRYPG